MCMKKVVFLDRDGTINVDHGYVYSRDQWQWTEGVFEGLQLLQQAGFVLAIITNQSGIAHGFYLEEDMHALHAFMTSELQKHGVTIAAIAFCPHGRDQLDCDCRKPRIGMAKHIEAKIGAIDYASSWTIGDKIADLEFGKNAGTHTALLESTYWKKDELTLTPDIVAESLLKAATRITQNI